MICELTVVNLIRHTIFSCYVAMKCIRDYRGIVIKKIKILSENVDDIRRCVQCYRVHDSTSIYINYNKCLSVRDNRKDDKTLLYEYHLTNDKTIAIRLSKFDGKLYAHLVSQIEDYTKDDLLSMNHFAPFLLTIDGEIFREYLNYHLATVIDILSAEIHLSMIVKYFDYNLKLIEKLMKISTVYKIFIIPNHDDDNWNYLENNFVVKKHNDRFAYGVNLLTYVDFIDGSKRIDVNVYSHLSNLEHSGKFLITNTAKSYKRLIKAFIRYYDEFRNLQTLKYIVTVESGYLVCMLNQNLTIKTLSFYEARLCELILEYDC